jgi:hypothetical protein
MKTLGAIFFGLSLLLTSAITAQCQLHGYQSPAISDAELPEPETYQVVISEIMADPFPAVGLPDAEYIELYNRDESGVSLEGCRLVIGKAEKVLPAVVLESNAYLIICDAGKESLFPSFVKIIAVEHLPPVLNSGQTVTLRSRSGKIIFSVDFTDRWYKSKEKAEGGWSLEIIDPENFCGREDNWCASIDPRGGTPGSGNSVNRENPDNQRPNLLRATWNADSSVMLHFSESMDSTSLDDPASFSASHGLLHPAHVDPTEPGYASVSLYFNASPKPGIIYSVTVLKIPKDCAGNLLADNAFANFGLPQPSDSPDVVINELLFDTPSGMSEFIELYNRSSKIIDLEEFSLALCAPVSDSTLKRTPLRGNPFLLFPGHYVAVTRRADQLPYLSGHPDLSTVVEQPLLFVLPDRQGEITLAGKAGRIIDRFGYSREMHSAFLSKTEGISLERINADLPANDRNNWHSASSLVGYATPGFENSQHVSSVKETEDIVITPEIFSPDDDGTDDVTVLDVEPGNPGSMANIRIFDMRGMMVRTLATQALLGTRSLFTWDGTCNDQTRADIGIYLIYIEIYTEQGHIKNYRKVVTLTRRL